MCIMEVRPGQRTATIAQAMAHNTSTIERDLEMFVSLLEARGDAATIAVVMDARERMETAYRALLSVFAQEVAAELPDEPVGNERHVHPHDAEIVADAGALMGGRAGFDGARFAAAATRDALAAERYETR